MSSRAADCVWSCSICAGERFSAWRWEGLVSCGQCGHVQQFSEERSRTDAAFQEEFFDVRFVDQADFFTRFYEGLTSRRRLRDLRGVVPSGRVLEVGVGRGGLLVALRSAGYTVEGLDISADLSREIQCRYGLTVHRGTLEALAQTHRVAAYDLVIMCHVLEHVELPLAALRAAKRLLRPGGALYVAVPNRLAWSARLPGWTGYQPYHVHYFSASGLRQAIEAAGLQVREEATVEPLTGWFNAIFESLRTRRPNIAPLSRRPAGRAKRGTAWFAYNVARIGAGLAVAPFRWLQGRLGGGEELVVVAQTVQEGG